MPPLLVGILFTGRAYLEVKFPKFLLCPCGILIGYDLLFHKTALTNVDCAYFDSVWPTI